MSAVRGDIGKISKPRQRFTPERRQRDVHEPTVAAHNQRVGEIIHAYNLAHSNLFVIFRRLAPEPTQDAALDLWHTSKTDRGQREMLAAMVKHTNKLGGVYRNAIMWAIGRLGELSEYRNNAAHVEMRHYYDVAVIGASAKHSAAIDLKNSPIDKHHRDLVGDLFALGNYLFDIEVDLLMGEALPSSRRPRLKLARSVSAAAQKQKKKAKKAARDRQRQSSKTDNRDPDSG